jgi:hypothetical protein
MSAEGAKKRWISFKKIHVPTGTNNYFPVFAWVVWIVFDFVLYPSLPIAMFEAGTVNLGSANIIFPFTYGIAIFSLAFALYRFSRIMSWWKAVPFAVSVPFAFTALFELVWSNAYYITGGWRWEPLWYLALGIWLLLGFSSIRYWKFTSKSMMVLTALVICWTVWIAIGYPQITGYHTLGVSTEYLYAFNLNVTTKVLSGLLFIVLIHDGTKVIHR